MGSCRCYLPSLPNVPSSLSQQTLSLGHATIILIAGYCHWLLFGLPTFTLTALHSILHTVSRINSLEYRSDVTPIFMSFKCFLWLSVQSQILGLVYKALHVLAPTHSPAPPAPLQTLQLSSAPQRHCAYLPPLTASSPWSALLSLRHSLYFRGSSLTSWPDQFSHYILSSELCVSFLEPLPQVVFVYIIT